DYHPTFAPKIIKEWRLGLENMTKVFGADENILSRTSTNFNFAPMQGVNGVLKYPKSQMFQYLHYGSYDDFLDEGNLYHQVVETGTTCFKSKMFQIIRFLIKTIFTEHPYRYIEKDYPYAEIVINSEKVEIDNSTSTNYFSDGVNYIQTAYQYYPDNERKIQQVTHTYSA